MLKLSFPFQRISPLCLENDFFNSSWYGDIALGRSRFEGLNDIV